MKNFVSILIAIFVLTTVAADAAQAMATARI
jgi:hypothetical protein